jgi:hypothetical protein
MDVLVSKLIKWKIIVIHIPIIQLILLTRWDLPRRQYRFCHALRVAFVVTQEALHTYERDSWVAINSVNWGFVGHTPKWLQVCHGVLLQDVALKSLTFRFHTPNTFGISLEVFPKAFGVCLDGSPRRLSLNSIRSSYGLK